MMLKRTTQFALAVVCVLMVALPTVAVGAPVIESGGLSFTGTFGSSTLEAQEEPLITCEGQNHMSGSFNAGGTGGTITIDYTNCHLEIIQITIPCRTTGAPINNTVILSGIGFDLEYTNASKAPGILMTNLTKTVECSGMNFKISGSVMGTITEPACGGTSNMMTFAFRATNSIQEHMQIGGAGTNFDLSEATSGGSNKTAGLNMTATVAFEGGRSQKLTCP